MTNHSERRSVRTATTEFDLMRNPKAYSRFALGQWETALHCNDVSHWLGVNLESAPCYTEQLIVVANGETVKQCQPRLLIVLPLMLLPAAQFCCGVQRYITPQNSSSFAGGVVVIEKPKPFTNQVDRDHISFPAISSWVTEINRCQTLGRAWM